MRCKTKKGFLLVRKDKSFAAYLEDQYYDLMFKRLKSYIFQNRERLNLHTSLVPDPSYTELDDLHVMGVSFQETEDDCKFRIIGASGPEDRRAIPVETA